MMRVLKSRAKDTRMRMRGLVEVNSFGLSPAMTWRRSKDHAYVGNRRNSLTMCSSLIRDHRLARKTICNVSLDVLRLVAGCHTGAMALQCLDSPSRIRARCSFASVPQMDGCAEDLVVHTRRCVLISRTPSLLTWAVLW